MDVVDFVAQVPVTGMKRKGNFFDRVPHRAEPAFARRGALNYNDAFVVRSRSAPMSSYWKRGTGKRRLFRRGYDRTGGRYFKRGGFRKEVKNFDQTSMAIASGSGTYQNPTTPANGELLVGLAQGTAATQRIGRKFTVKSIQMRHLINFVPGAGAVGTDMAKWVLVHDRQANGASPANTDVFSASNVGQDLLNLDNSKRFRVLATGTEYFQAAAGVSGAYDSQVRNIDFFKKLNIRVEMNSTAGAITEIKDNNLLLFFGSTNNLCTLTGNARIRFYDN